LLNQSDTTAKDGNGNMEAAGQNRKVSKNRRSSMKQGGNDKKEFSEKFEKGRSKNQQENQDQITGIIICKKSKDLGSEGASE
jgi:hypothetical protein